MVAEIDAAQKDGDTLGGVVEVLAYGLPPGLGSHVHWDRRLDSRLAGALMGIQAIKGVEVGDGFESARRRGSEAHDEIERDADGALHRRTARAGGVEGGMTTGEPLRVRAAMKPISTVPRALDTVDVATGEPATAINQRTDVCAVPAAGIVAEAMVALVLADAVLEKFGGDSVQETARNAAAYLANLASHLMPPVVVLVGPPGAGKTTVGAPRCRAARCDEPRHRRRRRGHQRQPVSDLFVEQGEAHFRELEREAVATAVAEHDGVLALGGGAVLDDATRALLRDQRVVFLDVGIKDAASRIGLNRDRPLLIGNPRAQWIRLMEARRPLYEEVASATVVTDGLTPDEVADRVVAEAGL